MIFAYIIGEFISPVLPGVQEIDRQFDSFPAAQEYDHIIKDIDFIQISKESNSSTDNNFAICHSQSRTKKQSYLTWLANSMAFYKRSLLLGAAGVVKSIVINEIVKTTESFYRESSIPTGRAADNTKGQTVRLTIKFNIK